MNIDYKLIPASTMVSLERWIRNGVPTGDFLRAVLENNLMEACGRADVWNREALCDIVAWVYWEAPMQCWGSPEKVEAWREFHAGRVMAKDAV